MAKWQLPARQISEGGWIQVVLHKPGFPPRDVTFFRDVPTTVASFSNADPFGDSTAELSFPQISVFDDPLGSEFFKWFGLFTNVDLYWVPAVKQADYPAADLGRAWINPITGNPDIFAPSYFLGGLGGHHDLRTKIWEGFVTSIDYTQDDQGSSCSMQCQGALFQLDRYLQKPYYPPRPVPLETLIKEVFEKRFKPHLRTHPLVIDFPAGWNKEIPKRPSTKGLNDAEILDQGIYIIDGKPGENWTGYASRQTGAWDRCLTGFIQDQLAVMVVGHGWSGGGSHAAVTGSQWTVVQQQQDSSNPGRMPVLQVRDNTRSADFSVWLGTPGITASFTRDGTQMANIAYGDGQSLDGTTWRNAVISNDGSRTDYRPLAYDAGVYPYTGSRIVSTETFVEEAYLKFGPGFSQEQATTSAQHQLMRDLDPGFTGTITMKIDPAEDMPKWLVRAGMTVKVFGLTGTADEGVKFHISSVQASVADNSIELTVDTRYRDLLTIQEARARTHDPLTPTRMLQVNRTSVLIEDLVAPWDTQAGSGFMPLQSKDWWAAKPSDIIFPYVKHFALYPPRTHSHWYTKCKANTGWGKPDTAARRRGRWARAPILTSEKGTLRRIEIIAVDIDGNILQVPFHASLYYQRPTVDGMPYDSKGPSPYINNANTLVDPATGLPWPAGNSLQPEPINIAVWGGKYNGVFDRAGFYPGEEVRGSPASGIFVDETPLSYDNTTGNQHFPQNTTVNGPGDAKHNTYTLYMMFYCEYSKPVYFFGRMWRQEPGSN